MESVDDLGCSIPNVSMVSLTALCLVCNKIYPWDNWYSVRAAQRPEARLLVDRWRYARCLYRLERVQQIWYNII